MEQYNIKDMVGGWFIGNFLPSVRRSSDFEVGYKLHKKGEKWPVHLHKDVSEVTLIIRGRMKIQDRILSDGDIFVIKPWEIADPVFLEDCEVVIVKTPSVPGDKYEYVPKEDK